jgi:hypothetical protein
MWADALPDTRLLDRCKRSAGKKRAVKTALKSKSGRCEIEEKTVQNLDQVSKITFES